MKRPPLFIFCLDGGDAGFITRWAGEGYLPTIASLMQRGCRGTVGGPELMSTQGAWLSLFSGVSRSEHGYYYNRQLVPGTYDLRAMDAGDAAAKPFWAQFRDGVRRIVIIDAPEAEPIPGLSGVQLSNWAAQQQYNHAIIPPSAEPPGLLQAVERQIGPPIHVDVFKPGSSAEEDAAAYRLMLSRIEKKGSLCRHVLAQDRCDMAVISFVEAHTAAHRLWDYRPGGRRQNKAVMEGSSLSTAIREVYRAIDREIGLLLKQLPDQSNVFVISLFGMKDLYPTAGLLEAFCRKLEYQVPSKAAGAAPNGLALVRRVIPADMRARISRFLPRHVQGYLEADRFRTETDWTKTTAFCLPSLNSSFVRVNLRGREPQGVIEPGSQYERLLHQIEADLKQLVDVRSGMPAVERIIRTAQAYRCGPPSALPDLAIEWTSTPYFMDRVRHPKAELIQVRPHYNRSSYHGFGGFVAAAGPSIPSGGDLGEVSPLEFVPAFRYLMDQADLGKPAGRLVSRLILHQPSNSGGKPVPTEVS